jgi:hypothetical protein
MSVELNTATVRPPSRTTRAAILAGVTAQTLVAWCQRYADFPPVTKIASRRFVDEQALLAWLKSKQEGGGR